MRVLSGGRIGISLGAFNEAREGGEWDELTLLVV